jgi:small subunit ribosomal protein S6
MTATRQYELIYIVAPDTTEEGVADLHRQVEGIVSRFGGQIEKSENWGRRKLAYEIDHHKEGTYVLELINAPGDVVRELDRRLRVTDQVIRHLVVRVDEDRRVAEQSTARRRENQARRRRARGLPPEPESGERSGVDRRAGHEDQESADRWQKHGGLEDER